MQARVEWLLEWLQLLAEEGSIWEKDYYKHDILVLWNQLQHAGRFSTIMMASGWGQGTSAVHRRLQL